MWGTLPNLFQTVCQFRLVANLAGPKGDHSPARRRELLTDSLIPTNIPVKFLIPIGDIRSGPLRSLATRMLMPKTAVHKDNGLILRQYDIRFTGKLLNILAKPVPKAMQKRTDRHLRASVPTSNAGHGVRPLISGNLVGHKSTDSRVPHMGNRQPLPALPVETGTAGIELGPLYGRSSHRSSNLGKSLALFLPKAVGCTVRRRGWLCNKGD